MGVSDLYPYRFDWGKITAEGYNDETNEVMLIFNVDIRNEAKVNNVIQYVFGRLYYAINNFPENALLRITFDIRGQNIIMSKSENLKVKLLGLIQAAKINNSVLIEFVR